MLIKSKLKVFANGDVRWWGREGETMSLINYYKELSEIFDREPLTTGVTCNMAEPTEQHPCEGRDYSTYYIDEEGASVMEYWFWYESKNKHYRVTKEKWDERNE